MIRHSHLPILLLLCLTGCVQYAKVKERRPEPPPAVETSSAEVLAGAGKRLAKDPQEALLTIIDEVARAEQTLRQQPRNTQALVAYNHALSWLFTAIYRMPQPVWDRPYEVRGPGALRMQPDAQHPNPRLTSPLPGWTIQVKLDSRYPERHPRLYDYIPAENLDISGSYVKERSLKAGLGAPLVAVRKEERPDARERFALERGHYGVTGVARFRGRVCEIEFLDPLAVETVALHGRAYPLAADFTAPLAMLLRDTRPRRLEILNLLRPGEPADSARIVRLQPFDPDKTTVLFVHGLVDSPATWVPMIQSLRADPYIRKRYQFWFYGYPSGYPYEFSAAIMRKELDAALKVFPQKKPMIFAGHSMGGLICRLMITDSTDKLWKQLYSEPLDSMPLTAESRETLRGNYFFKARPEVSRVVFIASPHRGSKLASSWLGRFGARLIRVPALLAQTSLEIATLGLVTSSKPMRHTPNSVDTLSPDNAFVKAINQIPRKRGVPVHSIIGDRGKGDTPNSSDGVVPYWSSHLEDAHSEKIVPSDHSAHQHPEAIAEMRRLLKSIH